MDRHAALRGHREKTAAEKLIVGMSEKCKQSGHDGAILHGLLRL
jgi:hypothetical protein